MFAVLFKGISLTQTSHNIARKAVPFYHKCTVIVYLHQVIKRCIKLLARGLKTCTFGVEVTDDPSVNRLVLRMRGDGPPPRADSRPESGARPLRSSRPVRVSLVPPSCSEPPSASQSPASGV